MKKVLFFAIVACFLSVSFSSGKRTLAQSKSPLPTVSPTKSATSPTPASQDLIEKLKQIEILKEKIATKVAETRDEEKKALLGTIKQIQNSTITLATKSGESKFNYSEDTLIYEFIENSKKESAADKLSNGLTVSAFGNLNEDKSALLAKYIFIQKDINRIVGKIADIDKSNFTITVKAKDGDKIIDIENFTKSTFYTKGKGGQKGGFSKFKVGDYVFLTVEKNPKEENSFSALRIVNIPLESTISPTNLAPIPSPTP